MTGTWRWLSFALAAGVGAAAAALSFAPAEFVGYALAEATRGRVHLADVSGTLWNGRARVVVADHLGAIGEDRIVVPGFAIPGQLRWTIRALPLVVGLVEASIGIDSMPAPVRLSGVPTELRVGAGRLDLSSAQLAGLGSPWNTIQPAGALAMNWDALTIRDGVLDGRANIELRDVASAMTPVRPLGSYRIDVAGNGRDVTIALRTLSGALQLQGRGSWDRSAGLRFSADATAQGPQAQRLQSLLALIGRREGERTIIRIGG
ncbi:MAG: type II secretion system protein N [Burkholderiaceae bacterium]|nr:type II secretion system protein N [Burkholderiaceae bacterium]